MRPTATFWNPKLYNRFICPPEHKKPTKQNKCTTWPSRVCSCFVFRTQFCSSFHGLRPGYTGQVATRIKKKKKKLQQRCARNIEHHVTWYRGRFFEQLLIRQHVASLTTQVKNSQRITDIVARKIAVTSCPCNTTLILHVLIEVS